MEASHTAAVGDHGAEAQLMTGVVDIVKAYMDKNAVEPASLPGLVKGVYAALKEAAADGVQHVFPAVAADAVVAEAEAPVEVYKFSHLPRVPHVPVDESVQSDHLVCLLDGKKGKMLKRHLRARYGMEWNEYKTHFGLSESYPSVAPGYSAEKSYVAKKQGLGLTVDKTPRDARTADKVRVAA